MEPTFEFLKREFTLIDTVTVEQNITAEYSTSELIAAVDNRSQSVAIAFNRWTFTNGWMLDFHSEVDSIHYKWDGHTALHKTTTELFEMFKKENQI